MKKGNNEQFPCENRSAAQMFRLENWQREEGDIRLVANQRRRE